MKLIDWIGIICFILALVILWQFRQVMLLIFTAVVLSIILNSIVRWLMRRWRLRRGWAVFLTLVLVLLGGGLFLGLLLPFFIARLQQLLSLIPMALERLEETLEDWLINPPRWLPFFDEDSATTDMPLDFLLLNLETLLNQLATISTQVFDNFVLFFSTSAAVLLQTLLAIALTVMILADPMSYRRLLIRLFPSRYRRRSDEILSKCEVALLAWVGAVAGNSIFVAGLSFLGLVVLRVDFALTHAVIAGVFNFVPNIGPLLSSVFPIMVALLDSPGKAIAVVVLYLIVQNLESYWFSPMMMQKQVSLLPATTLIAQLFFASFFGLIGFILALPLAVVLKVCLEEALVKDILDRDQSARGDRSS